MIIHKDYSAECRRLFGTSIYGMDFASLLFPGDAEQQDYVRKVAGKILALEDLGIRWSCICHLMHRPFIVLNGFTIHFEYNLIKEDSFSNEKKIMAIITDITERCVLENQMEQEKNTFKMVVKVVTSHHDFLILVSEFQEFLRDGIREIIYGSPDMQEAVNELFRRVHTFKGNFAMMNMQRTVDTLHQAEDVLSELKAAVNQKSRDELFFVASAMDLQSGYQADIQTIRSILGDHQYGQTESMLR
jgi:two-component system chemotaxis sensor kinase CheA